ITEQVLCSSDLTTGLHRHLTSLSYLNSFLSVTAFLKNVLILIALHKESSLHPPSNLLLRTLVTTNFCVGLTAEPLALSCWMSEVNDHRNICRFVLPAALLTGSILCLLSPWTLSAISVDSLLVLLLGSEPLAVIYWISMSAENEDWNICHYIFAVGLLAGNVLSGVSLMTMTVISVDRLLALLLGLRYRQVVTLKRTYVIVITLWVVSAVFSAVQLRNRLITIWYEVIVSSLCLVTSVFCYTKIFFTLRHHQLQVQGHVQQPNQTNQLNIARYKKAVFTALWLQLTLVACYLPHGVVEALVTNGGLSSTSYFCAWSYATTLVFLNSSLNPILYFWKLEEVRQAVKDTIRQALCHCFST
ncbi:melanocyte-stimulating hormone receptor-like, partial [Orbicella faveolata]|uniref:melanocyte-stimulating hormone receptor-like n=1 Tax=Orbicella faveolata TaxID=48498 RepID=UPI0009E29B16